MTEKDRMRLWVITTKGDVGYDEYDGFVVRAKTEQEARLIAYDHAGDEGGETWRNPEYSDCIELTKNGEAGVILSSFNAG